jgi:phosphohistidine phosphatase
MFRLLLLRHAKAERDSADGDHGRRLTDRGRRDATRVGRFLAAAELVPDLVVSSTAARTRETAELAREAGGWKAPVRETRALYDTTIERALDVLRKVDAEVATVMLVGHEPTWSALASIVIGGGRLRLPTAGLASIDLEVAGWSEVAPGTGELRALVTPALLEALDRG